MPNQNSNQSSDDLSLYPKPRGGAKHIFISHAHEDGNLAKILHTMLRVSFPGATVFCSSIDGHGLEARDDLDLIRSHVKNSIVFIALYTTVSRQSDWVMFELGARWGMSGDKPPNVHLAAGAAVNDLPKPIAGKLVFTKESQGTMLLRDVAKQLSVEPPDIYAYETYLNDFVEASNMIKEERFRDNPR